jgi:Flp pilus assembly protein TadG
MLRAVGKFVRDRVGNVAVTFALTIFPIIAGIGGAVDFTRSVTIGTEIQSAIDSGVLAAASLSQARDPEDVVRAYIEAAISEYGGEISRLEVTVNSDTSLNSREVIAVAEVTVPTLLLGLAGINELIVTRTAEAVEQLVDIEIALVLDVSGSMGGSKIADLRDAAQDFVNTVLGQDRFEYTSLSVIPYNGGVRLPETVNDALIQGAPAYRRQSGCADYETDYPVDFPLPDNELDWLEWNGQDMVGSRSSAFCPAEDMESVFLLADKDALNDMIGGLVASGNTGLDVATAWGVRALDPNWRGRLGGDFPDRPVDWETEDTLKVLVVMTDGAATAQIRTRWENNRWRTFNMYSASQARSNMLDACDYAKDNGVAIYTIAFQVSGSTNRNLMRDCATTAGNFYNVENTDIGAAFSAIAGEINKLRLRQ